MHSILTIPVRHFDLLQISHLPIFCSCFSNSSRAQPREGKVARCEGNGNFARCEGNGNRGDLRKAVNIPKLKITNCIFVYIYIIMSPFQGSNMVKYIYIYIHIIIGCIYIYVIIYIYHIIYHNWICSKNIRYI